MKHRWTAALLALALVLALPFSAAAETFSTEDFTMEIPEGTYVFTPTTSTEDPNWAMAGVADPTTKLQTYQDMHGIAELITQDGETSILIMQKQTDTTESIFSLRDLSEEDKEEFLDGTMQSKSEDILVEKYYIDVNGQPFYRLRVDGSPEGMEYHEVQYATIINGYSLGFGIYGGDETVTQEQEDMLLGIVESITFSEILEKPETTITLQDYVVVAAVLVLLVLVILIPAV